MTNYILNPHKIRQDLSSYKKTEIIKWYDESEEEHKHLEIENIEDLDEER